MSSRWRARCVSRVAAVAGGVLALVAVTVVIPSSASATTQPVTVVTSVNGVVGAPAYTGASTSVSFAVTNRSTKGAKLDAFSFVLPPGLTGVARGTVAGPGKWNETILRCGSTRNCSAIILVTAGLPLKTSLVGPGGTVTATICFKAPGVATTLSFPFIGIGEGIFTVSGPTPTVRVIDGTVTTFGVVVTPPVVAGTATSVAVSSLNAANQVVPFSGGAVTATISGADAGGSVQATAFTGGTSAVVTVPATSSGLFSLSSVFTKAQAQSIHLQSGSIAGTSNPFTVISGAPKSLQLTSITDTSNTPPLPTPAANQSFAVAFTAYDAFGNVATQSGVPVTLTALNAVGGALDPSTPVGATGSNGSGSIPTKYSAAQTGLELQVSSPGLTPGTGTTDVVTAGAAENGTPGTPAELAAGNAAADLPNGSYGPVFLTTAPCSDDNCGQGVEITLDGTFTDPNPAPGAPSVTHLYTDAAPGEVSWTCSDSVCPHPDAEPPGETYLPEPGDTDDEEQAEDFEAYPIQVSLKVDGVYEDFATAPSCRDLTDPNEVGLTGAIVTPEAQAAGFCVDVYAISRVDDSFSGDLTIPVLFVEDPKLRPTS
jgi:hypothetical protein